MPVEGTNLVELSGKLVESQGLRFTPAGIPIVRFRIEHSSVQREADGSRQVTCLLNAVAVATDARLIAALHLGSELVIKGFLDKESLKGSRLELHASHIEFRNT
jgi:primosomal replication protein N